MFPGPFTFFVCLFLSLFFVVVFFLCSLGSQLKKTSKRVFPKTMSQILCCVSVPLVLLANGWILTCEQADGKFSAANARSYVGYLVKAEKDENCFAALGLKDKKVEYLSSAHASRIQLSSLLTFRLVWINQAGARCACFFFFGFVFVLPHRSILSVLRPEGWSFSAPSAPLMPLLAVDVSLRVLCLCGVSRRAATLAPITASWSRSWRVHSG